MADAADENYHVETHKSKHKRGDRTERRQRGVNRHGDGIDGTPSPAKERNNPGLDDSGVTNDCASSVDRESGRRERRDRRKPKEDGETNANDEASVEGATAAPEESSPKKSLKKDRKSENSAHKRQQKRHLREKRRSTGVVIMPAGADADSEDEDAITKQVKSNTQQNEQANDDEDQIEATPSNDGTNNRIEQKVQKDSQTIQTQQLLEKIDDYEAQLEDYKSELDKVNKELDQLRIDNNRLKDENSSLLRVISQLSSMKPMK
ncbi:PRKC apoptosis WT1 regulator protein-like [Montipora capricornis]|uniref:PRKC apoptosis WT1 regulator protein-like n=1 Tax=Montipora foliosa TaxID=591990 RepID=UPI0035F1B1EC